MRANSSPVRAGLITAAGAAVLLLLALCGSVPARGQEAIDWQKARVLYQKGQRGETLSTDERIYLERAKSERQKRGFPDGQAARNVPPARSSTGMIPLNEMTASDSYKGQDGGLYGGGRNQPPEVLAQAATDLASKIVPRDEQGRPSKKGKIVLLTIGMSNTTMDSEVFKRLADADPSKSASVVIVDGAQGGQDAAAWARTDARAWSVVEERLHAAGVTPQQVQAVWLKQARMGPAAFGEFPKHNIEFEGHVTKSIGLAHEKYPDLKLVFLSSRVYAGYAKTPLNPEPYAYEGGFAMRDLILKQMGQKGKIEAPLLLWGPYLWADGVRPRKSDQLVWNEEDFVERDRTHPSNSGREKVARMLLQFFKTDPSAQPWFCASKD